MEFVNQLNEAFKDIDVFLQGLKPAEREKFEQCLYMSRYPMYEMVNNLDWDFFSSQIIILEFHPTDEDFYNEEDPIDVVRVDDETNFLTSINDYIEQGITLVTIGFNYEDSGHQNVMIFYRHKNNIQVLYVEPHGSFKGDYEQYEKILLTNDITADFVALFHFLYQRYRSKLKDLIEQKFSTIDLLNIQQQIYDPTNLVGKCLDNIDLINKDEMAKFYKEMLELNYIRELQSQIQYKILTPIKGNLDYMGDLKNFNLNHYEFDTENINLQKVDDAGYCETVVVLNLFLGNLITECQADYCSINPDFSQIKYTDLVKNILKQIENVMNNKNIFTSKLCREGKWLCAFNIFFFLYCVVNDLFNEEFNMDKTASQAKEQYDVDYNRNATIDIFECNYLLFRKIPDPKNPFEEIFTPVMRYMKDIINQRVEKIRDALLIDMADIYPKMERGRKRIRTVEDVARKKYKFSYN